MTIGACGRDCPGHFGNPGDIAIEPVDAEQADIAANAYRRYGKGHHPAGLNLGDVFAYALARQRGAPLLFKGNDFVQTDVEAAVLAAGDPHRQSTQSASEADPTQTPPW